MNLIAVHFKPTNQEKKLCGGIEKVKQGSGQEAYKNGVLLPPGGSSVL